MPSEALTAGAHTVETAWAWYSAQKRVWFQVRASVLEAMVKGAGMPFVEFAGMTEAEFEKRYTAIVEELAQLACLGILSAAEGELRMDYLRRVTRRDKSKIGRRFRGIFKDHQARVPLEDGILKLWRSEHPELSSKLSRFKAALGYRHWLAHGRYWVPKLGQRYLPESVYEICMPIVAIVRK